MLSFFCKNLNNVFDLYITTPSGDEISLNSYQGKSLLIVVLPATHTSGDTALLQLLHSLSVTYADSVTIIGIPSYEDGFADDSLSSIMGFYQSLLGNQVIVSGAMNTRKNSAYQSPLFSYLTYADQNGYFDDDVSGAGEKFFVDNIGNLYGISAQDADFNTDVFLSMLNHTVSQ